MKIHFFLQTNIHALENTEWFCTYPTGHNIPLTMAQVDQLGLQGPSLGLYICNQKKILKFSNESKPESFTQN